MVRRGRIGEPRYFSSAFSMHGEAGGIRTQRETGGGSIYDLGIYCINAARMFLGAEPTQVFGTRHSRRSIRHARGRRHDRGGPAVRRRSAGDVHDQLCRRRRLFVPRRRHREADLHADPAYEFAEPLAYTLTIGERTTKKRGATRPVRRRAALFLALHPRRRAPRAVGEEGAWDVRIVDALSSRRAGARPSRCVRSKVSRRRGAIRRFPGRRYASQSSSTSRSRMRIDAARDCFGAAGDPTMGTYFLPGGVSMVRKTLMVVRSSISATICAKLSLSRRS